MQNCSLFLGSTLWELGLSSWSAGEKMSISNQGRGKGTFHSKATCEVAKEA